MTARASVAVKRDNRDFSIGVLRCSQDKLRHLRPRPLRINLVLDTAILDTIRPARVRPVLPKLAGAPCRDADYETQPGAIMHRRDVLKTALCGAASAVLRPTLAMTAQDSLEIETAAPLTRAEIEQRICLFTDHLDDFGLSFEDLARMLEPLKITGPDLTVRSGGFVPPDAVADELPRAARALADRGLSIPMISTGLTAADDTATETFRAMHSLGIRYYKLGYFPYGDLDKWETTIDETREAIAGLMELGREFEVIAGIHNHAGASVGGALWDAWQVLSPLDSQRVGFYFDPAQAMLEGSKHAWKLNFQRISPRLTMVAVKDFLWEQVGGEWRTRWVPLGEGMVDWPEFFSMLARVPFDGPLSLHIEYDPGGATRAERIENNLAATRRDLQFLRRQLDSAYSGG